MGRLTLKSNSEIPEGSSYSSYSDDHAILQSMMGSQDNVRIVMLHGDVNEHTISNVIVQLLFLANQNHKPIYLVISTYGGSIDEMFSLYDTIKFLPCPVHTIALGKVMSAGVLLLAAGTKGKRVIGKSARIMIHPVSGGAHGNVFEVINEIEEHKRLQELMVKTLASETSISEETISNMMKCGHDVYITPEKALEYGIVDKMI
jgi:ATP-dependent Clp protease protease subunit